jgi:hypothetical protein
MQTSMSSCGEAEFEAIIMDRCFAQVRAAVVLQKAKRLQPRPFGDHRQMHLAHVAVERRLILRADGTDVIGAAQKHRAALLLRPC